MAHVDLALYLMGVEEQTIWRLDGNYGFHWITLPNLYEALNTGHWDGGCITVNPGYDYCSVNQDIFEVIGDGDKTEVFEVCLVFDLAKIEHVSRRRVYTAHWEEWEWDIDANIPIVGEAIIGFGYRKQEDATYLKKLFKEYRKVGRDYYMLPVRRVMKATPHEVHDRWVRAPLDEDDAAELARLEAKEKASETTGPEQSQPGVV